jgi:two-component system response regulator YesN
MLKCKKTEENIKLIREMTDFVREHLHENITLRNVANRFSFSPNYLGTIFKDATGRNFSDSVIELRMEKACDLLKNSNLKIYEIADRVGYKYLPYFSRQFRESYGVTPGEYRKRT